MSTAWYGGQSDVEGAAIGSLAVIAPLLQQMGIEEIIDQHLPVDPQAEFNHGKIASVLIAARVYSPVALSQLTGWAEKSGADVLWGIEASKLNDDRFGRLLDAFFAQRHAILSAIALRVVETFGVPLNDIHYDPTHVLFTGAYADSVARDGVVGVSEDGKQPVIRLNDTLEPAHITKGRTMDDAPKGAKMIHVGLGVVVDEYGPMPICGHTIDGNQNGRTAVHEQTELLKHQFPNLKLTIISDRGTYSVGHLLRLKDAGCSAICSVPWRELSDLFDKHHSSLKWADATYQSIEQQRRRDKGSSLPQEKYSIAVLKHTLHDGEKTAKHPKGRDIDCRVVFIHSTADEKVVRQQRQKQIERIKQELTALLVSIANGRGKTDTVSMSKRTAKACGSSAAVKYFSWKLVELTAKEIAALPKPGKGCSKQTHRFEFTFDEKQVKADEQYDGYNALVTTVPPTEASADSLFTRFKQQAYSEQVNSEFKGPLAVRPVFLHTPRRIESLMFLLVIALMVHYLIQRQYRKSLPPDASAKEQRTTTSTLLSEFKNYTFLIQHSPQGRIVSPTRLTTRQQDILRRLQLPTPAQILSRMLPRPPD